MKTHKIILLASILFAINSCKKPEAGFTADKTEAYVGDAIHFFDNGDMRKNCTFIYDYGNGVTSADNMYVNEGASINGSINERNPSYIYWRPGVYEVTQTIAIAGNLEKGKSKQVSSKLKITIKPINADFTISDTIATTSTVVQLNNTTQGGDMSWWSSNYGWTYVNTTSPELSSSISDAYVGNGNYTSSQGFVKFNAPGVWKVTLGIGGGSYSTYKTKTITIN